MRLFLIATLLLLILAMFLPPRAVDVLPVPPVTIEPHVNPIGEN